MGKEQEYRRLVQQRGRGEKQLSTNGRVLGPKNEGAGRGERLQNRKKELDKTVNTKLGALEWKTEEAEGESVAI